jgi:hypothetical protein
MATDDRHLEGDAAMTLPRTLIALGIALAAAAAVTAPVAAQGQRKGPALPAWMDAAEQMLCRHDAEIAAGIAQARVSGLTQAMVATSLRERVLEDEIARRPDLVERTRRIAEDVMPVFFGDLAVRAPPSPGATYGLALGRCLQEADEGRQ